jgi:sterol desaturase/sphingolipid hydroxylase (fatty acid hydroxylase superfamily)
MDLLIDSINQYLTLSYKEFLYIFNGVLFKKEYPFNIHWFLSSALVGILYFSYKSFKFKTYPIRILAFVRTKRYQKEFFKDCLYFSLRILYKPIFFGFLFLNAKHITSFFTNYAGFSYFRFDQPIIMLDPVYGIYLFAVLQLLLVDLTNFIAHYLEHKIPWIWYFHMTHHRATVLNPMTKSRIHPVAYIIGNVLISTLQVPGLLMLATAFNISRSMETKFATLLITYFIFSFIQHIRHSHIRINYGPILSRLISSPHMHQVHHSRNPIHFDKNFAIIFSIWDQIVGSYYLPSSKERFKFGLNDHEGRMPKSLWFDLFHPFTLIKADILSLLEKINKNQIPSNDLPFPINFETKKNTSNKNIQSAGYSLIELMISAAIATIIFLTGTIITLNLTSFGLKQSKITDAEQDLDRLIYVLKTVSAMAVNVRYTTMNLNGQQGTPDGSGFVRPFNYTQNNSLPVGRNSETLMFFARENRSTTNAPETLTSLFRPTGVFFMRKNDVFNNTRQGSRIIIDMGSANASGNVIPDDSDLVFNNISDLIIDQPQFSHANVLNSIRVTVSSIYSTISNKTGYDCLGPSGDITAGITCNANDNRILPFKIKTKVFTLKFINNKRNSPLSIGEFQNGVYLFKPVYAQ